MINQWLVNCLSWGMGCLLLVLANLSQAGTFEIVEYEQALIKAKFDQKAQIMASWYEADQAQAVHLMQLMLDSQLYYLKQDKRLYQVEDASSGAIAQRIHDGGLITLKKKRDVKRVSINNRLRSVFRQRVTETQLSAAKPQDRLAAAESIIGDTTPELMATIARLRLGETDASVLAAFDLVLAVATLHSSNEDQQRQSIRLLGESLHPASLNALNGFLLTYPQSPLIPMVGKYVEQINGKVDFYGSLETIYFGLSLGSVLVLAGIGLAITFGVMGVINMAHGELIMIGAYTTYLIQQLMPNHIGLSLLVAVPAAFLVSGAVGILIERGVIRFLYGRPLETLLATFGISLILQQAVRSIFSPLNRSVETPLWMTGVIDINPLLSLTQSRMYIIVFCLTIFLLLLAVMKRTRLGLQVRAVSQNRDMAKSMGVRSEWIDALTFGLGSGVAGVAGVALSQLTNVGPNMGQAYIIDSFMVVVFGGVGNLWGTLVAGLSLGVANKILEPWAGAVLSKVLVLIFIILFIQKRPRGLFPQRGRDAKG
ncbi:urea ABC transporter permease subunit UrtB [Candidatus Njordibacter sp. Uisw_056]|uniref:urea ABC transporter permease subunit UrtB n=1 Tax=Candidatus Njordibacter sp. Uisw_056 TaxID=3230973 RepID=UPI003D5CA12F